MDAELSEVCFESEVVYELSDAIGRMGDGLIA